MLDNIVKKVLPELIAHGEQTKPTEACGLVLKVLDNISYVPCHNLSSGEEFILDPADYVKAEDCGEVLMICHTHLEATHEPSSLDIIGCDFSELPWLIYSFSTCQHTVLMPKEPNENN